MQNTEIPCDIHRWANHVILHKYGHLNNLHSYEHLPAKISELKAHSVNSGVKG